MNIIRRLLSVVLIRHIFVLLVLYVFSTHSVFAAPGINQQINFQGKVVNKGVGVTNGTNVPNGNYDFQFRIYDAPTGGTLLWTENWNVGTTKVYVNSGIFSVALGTYTSLSPAIDFNTNNLYLSVNYNNDGEMTPRVRLSATPYALNAQKVGGLTVTNTNSTLTVANNKTITFGESFTTTGVGITLDQNLSTTSSPKFSGLTITSSGIGITGNSVFTNNVNIGGGSTIAGNLNVGGTIFGNISGTFSGNIGLNQILSSTNVSQNLIIGSGSTLSYVGTGMINASHLGSSSPSSFLNIGNTGNFLSNISLGPSGLSISGTGIGRTLTNTGLLDAANGTLSRSGSAGYYRIGLNLASANTWTANQTFTNATASRFYQAGNGIPTSNLGNPSVTEMALFDEQFNNKTEFYDINNIFVETSTDGIGWSGFTVTDSQKRMLVGGDAVSSLSIPYGTVYFRIRFLSVDYVYLNALYSYWSTNGHTSKVQIYKKHNAGPYTQHSASTADVSAWPGHLYLPFATIPFRLNGTLGTHFDEVSVVFIPTWNGTYPANNISIQKLQLWGGFPAGKRSLYATDEYGNVTFPGNINTPKNVTIGGTLVSVGSTNLVTNLNSQFLGGYSAPYFINIGQTGQFVSVGSSGAFISNISLGPSGLSISGTGIGRTLTNTGLVDISNGTLTRSGSAGLYTVGLNLGSTNTWTGAQTFGNLTIGGTFLSVGSTGLVSNLNASLLGGFNSSYFSRRASSENSIISTDTRNNNYLPVDRSAGLYSDFKANATDGLADGGTYHGVLTFRSYGSAGDFSGGNPYQIAYTENGNLWTRIGTGSSTWGTWYKNWNSNNDGVGSSLDADLFDGLDSSSFLQIGQSGGFVGIGSSGVLPYVNNATNGTLTRSGSGPYTLGLNLGNANTWTGIQNFSAGATVSNLSITGKATLPKIAIERNANTASGISWYNSSTFTAWAEYMGPAGLAGQGPTGNITAPTGTVVSSWGLRSFIENVGGYGWTWESGASGTTAPSIVAELSSNNGNFRTIGTGSFGNSALINGGGISYLNGGNVGIGTTNPLDKLHVLGNIRLGSGNYVYSIQDSVGTVLQTTRSDFSQTGTFRSNGWGDFTVNKSLGVGYDLAGGSVGVGNFFVSGNIGLGVTNSQSKLDILGSLAYRSTVGNYHYKNLASYTSDIGATTGMLKITMPKGWSSTMGVTTIKGYDYSSVGGWEVIVSGYNYSSPTPGWVNYSAEIRGDAPFNQVRLAYDVGTSKNVILIGTTSTAWNYPKAEVTDFFASFGSQTGWGNGWGMDLVSTEIGVSNTVDIVLQTYMASNGNFGINTTNPTSKFHVVGNGNFSTNLAIGATLSVTGRSVLSQNLTVNAGGIGVTGNSLFTNNLAIGATLSVTGRSVLSQNLTVNAGGIGVTGNSIFTNNLTIGGSIVSVGGTNLVTNLNSQYLNGQSSSYFVNIGQTGNFITNLTAGSGVAISGTGIGRTLSTNITNGLRYIGASIGLGGTLSQATALNLSTNSFRILGNGNTEAFYIGSNGNVGVGATNQSAKFTVMSKGDTASYGANVLTADGTFTAATGWTSGGNWSISGGLLNHTAGASVGITGISTATSTTTNYQISFNATTTNSTFKVSLGGVDSGLSIGTTGSALYYIYIKPSNTSGNLIITPSDSNYVGSIDNIVIRPVTTYSPSLAILNTDSTIGLEIRTSNISSSPNLFIGVDSGKNNTTGSQNTSLGSYALSNNFTGSKNSAFGSYSLYNNSTGIDNSAIGYMSLYNNVTGDYNVAVGSNSLYSNTSGYYNSALGNFTLNSNINGSNNAAFGNFALKFNLTGNRNAAFGNYSLYSNTVGSDNSSIGNNSLYLNTTGSNNVAIGNEALYSSNGNINTAIGYRAGYRLGTGSSNVFIGMDVGASGNYSNKLFIGKGQTPAIYGDLSNGYIGIGTTNPLSKLSFGNYYIGSETPNSSEQTSHIRLYDDTGGTSYGFGVSNSALNIAANQTSGRLRFYTNSLERMHISAIGNIGIGDTIPGTKLDINDTQSVTSFEGASNQGIRIGNYTSANNYSILGFSGYNRGYGKNLAQIGAEFTGSGSRLYFGTSNNYTTGITNTALAIDYTGNIGIGTTSPGAYKLNVRGTVCLDLNADGICTDNTAAISDARLKTNVTTLESSLDIVEKLRGVRFNWNGQNNTGYAESLGYIAQEVEQILPELVITDSNGYKNVDYSKIVAVATNAIQEQQLQLDDLKSKLIISSEGQIAVNMNVSEEVLNSLGYDGVKNEIENATYLVSDPVTGTVTMIGNFASATIGNLTAGLIKVTNIIADNILVKALTARLVKTDKLEVSLLTPMGNASAINVEGDLDINGNLKVLGAQIDDLQSNTASVSTLYADNIISPEGSMSAVMNNKVATLRSEIQNLLNISSTSTSEVANQSLIEAQRLSTQLSTIENSLSQGMVDQQNQIADLRNQLQQLIVLNSTTTVDTTNLVNKTLTVSVPYSGALFIKDGSNTTDGVMNTDNTLNIGGIGWKNYYQWTTSSSQIQDNTILFKITLPDNFVTWDSGECPGQNCPFEINYQTGTSLTDDNNISFKLFNENDLMNNIICSSYNNSSIVWNKLTCNQSQLQNNVISQWDTAGETSVVMIKMASKNTSSAFSRVSDIILRYKSKP